MSHTHLIWQAPEVFSFIKKEFPQVFTNGQIYEITALEPDCLTLGLRAGENQLRPGGTVSGPAQMEMADLAVYCLLLAHYGDAARLSVTTSLTCSFLRKPEAGKLVCDVKMLKHGRTLSIASAAIHQGNTERLVASMELTYFTGNILA